MAGVSGEGMERPSDLRIRIDDDTELRLYREEDAEEFLALINDNRGHLGTFMHWVDAVNRIEDELAFLSARVKEYQTGRGMSFAVVQGGHIVGAIGTVMMDRVNEVVELGYFVAEEHQGKGLMTLAVGAFIDHLFREEGMNRVCARIMPENEKSRALVERLGLTIEGVHREEYNLRGEHRDLVIHSILRSEWEARLEGRPGPG
jgi:ribosomal-protein-serine acetyltransferase